MTSWAWGVLVISILSLLLSIAAGCALRKAVLQRLLMIARNSAHRHVQAI